MGSLELMKEQVLAALSSCHVVGVTQEDADASRIGKCKGAPIRSGVSSELATELLPASPGHLIKLQNRCIEWSRMDNAPRAVTTVPHLYPHEVQRYHPCTCTRYNGATLLPARGTMYKRHEFHKRTTSRYKGGTVVPPEGTGVVPSYLRVQGWCRRTSRGTAVPPEDTHMVRSCLLDSARGALCTPSEPLPPPRHSRL